MEIKKYVLFEDGVLRVKDDILKDKIVTYDKETKEVKVDGKLFRRLSVEVKKTSDNILDLFEVGDLFSSNGISPIYFHKKVDNYFHGAFEYMNIKHIKYIWKLQTNGDYIRYEV